METIVKTKQGAVEGVRSKDGRTVIFKGVPYAEAPVGQLRFQRPQPKAPWEGVRPCKEFGPRCPQADLASMDFYGKEFYDDMVPPCNEDCLYLNIWAPEEGESLPVLFWIHGGAFMHGCSSEKEFDGEGFAKKGIVMVSVNYRVNAFGFFAHPDLEKENPEGVSGNYGILDQLFALKWVRENICAFGGDPDRITLCGQSAGCMSVQTLISSSLSKGMVSGAILQSGTGLPPRRSVPSREQAHAPSLRLMEYLHVQALDELRQVPAEALMQAAYAVQDPGVLGWRPHVDGWLVTGQMEDLAESGAIHDIPYMIGCTGDDIGGGVLRDGTAAWCENQLHLGRAPAYLYFFDRKLPGDNAGSFHSSELWYVFETLPRCWRPWEEHDRELSQAMSGHWANFVKTGDPNGPGLSRWEPYTEGHKAPMEFK